MIEILTLDGAWVILEEGLAANEVDEVLAHWQELLPSRSLRVRPPGDRNVTPLLYSDGEV